VKFNSRQYEAATGVGTAAGASFKQLPTKKHAREWVQMHVPCNQPPLNTTTTKMKLAKNKPGRSHELVARSSIFLIESPCADSNKMAGTTMTAWASGNIGQVQIVNHG